MTSDDRQQRQKRLAAGVTTFVVLSVDEAYLEWRKCVGPQAEQLLLDAIAAVNVLCDNEHGGPWASSEGRRYMRERLAQIEAQVRANGVDDEVRAMARTIVGAIFPSAEEWFEKNSGKDPGGTRR